MSRAIPFVAIALALSCSGRVLDSDSAGVSTSDAGAGDSAVEGSSTWTGGGDGCTPGGPPSVFWSDTTGSDGIMMDDANMYRSNGHAIFSCPISGCTSPTEIVSLHSGPPNVYPFAVDAVDIYFINAVDDSGGYTDIFRCPKSGCVGEPELVSPPGSNPADVTLDDTSVYWTSYAPSGATSAMRIGKDLTGATPVAGVERVDAVSHGSIFWIHQQTYPSDLNARIMSCPIAGCPDGATTVADKQSYISAIAFDDEKIYWTAEPQFSDTAGSVFSCPRSGCVGAPTTIATGSFAPDKLAVDGCGIYWIAGESGTMTNREGVFMCEKPACTGAPISVAADQVAPDEIMVNARGIFWLNINEGNVMRVLR